MTTSLRAAVAVSKSGVGGAAQPQKSAIKTISGSNSVGDVYAVVTGNCDAHWENTVLALDFEADLADLSTKQVSVTAPNGYTLSTDTVKYGINSLYLNGINQYLTLPNQPEFELKGANCWTIECWINPDQDYIPAIWRSGYPYDGFITDNQRARPLFGIRNFNQSGDAAVQISAITIVAGTWAHVALVSDPYSSRLYVNGEVVAKGPKLDISIANIGIGFGGAGLETPFAGYIDDVRITKGICRYYGSTINTPLELTGSDVLQGELWVYTGTGSFFGYNSAGEYKGRIPGNGVILDKIIDKDYLPGTVTRSVTNYNKTEMGYESGDYFNMTDSRLQIVLQDYYLTPLVDIVAINPTLVPDDKYHRYTWIQTGGEPVTWLTPQSAHNMVFKKPFVSKNLQPRYWRITNIQVEDSNWLEISELEFLIGEVAQTGVISSSVPPNIGNLDNGVANISYLNDGLTNTRAGWSKTSINSGFWIKLSSENPILVTGIRQAGYDVSGRHINSFTVQYSEDDLNWVTIDTFTVLPYPGNFTFSDIYELDPKYNQAEDSSDYDFRLVVDRGTSHEQFVETTVGGKIYDYSSVTTVLGQVSTIQIVPGSGLSSIGVKPGLSPVGTITYNNPDFLMVWSNPTDPYPAVYSYTEIFRIQNGIPQLLTTVDSNTTSYSDATINQPNLNDIYLFRTYYDIYGLGQIIDYVDKKVSFAQLENSVLDGTDSIVLNTSTTFASNITLEVLQYVEIIKQTLDPGDNVLVGSFTSNNSNILETSTQYLTLLTITSTDLNDSAVFNTYSKLLSSSTVKLYQLNFGNGIIQF